MRLATRASPLALAQARHVAELLGGGAELVPMSTAGDRDRTAGDKQRWVSDLEQALLRGDADAAVHSAKDVPSELADGLALVGSPRRADARDALCGARSLAELAPGARVGTSSLRRTAQLRAVRDDLDVVALRGNVDTRLRRLAERHCAAIVVALAGLQRLGRSEQAGAALDAGQFVPAAGQGTLALEARADDGEVVSRLRAIADPETDSCLRAERALVRALGADCHTPVGAHATPAPDGGYRLTVFVGRPDGSAWIRDQVEGSDPESLGRDAAERALRAGAGELLGR